MKLTGEIYALRTAAARTVGEVGFWRRVLPPRPAKPHTRSKLRAMRRQTGVKRMTPSVCNIVRFVHVCYGGHRKTKPALRRASCGEAGLRPRPAETQLAV